MSDIGIAKTFYRFPHHRNNIGLINGGGGANIFSLPSDHSYKEIDKIIQKVVIILI